MYLASHSIETNTPFISRQEDTERTALPPHDREPGQRALDDAFCRRLSAQDEAFTQLTGGHLVLRSGTWCYHNYLQNPDVQKNEEMSRATRSTRKLTQGQDGKELNYPSRHVPQQGSPLLLESIVAKPSSPSASTQLGLLP